LLGLAGFLGLGLHLFDSWLNFLWLDRSIFLLVAPESKLAILKTARTESIVALTSKEGLALSAHLGLFLLVDVHGIILFI